MSKDYYKILGVSKDTSPDDIKKAFKKLAMTHHPDRPGGNEAKFKEINEAYQVLGDKDKRAKYDQFGSDFETQGGFGGGAGWEDFMRSARGQSSAQFDFGDIDLGDLFGAAFGRGGRPTASRGAPKGRDIQVDVELDFKEAAFGVERELHLRKQSTCDVCGGNGAEPGSKLETCHTCQGQGQVVQTRSSFLGAMQTVVACPTCQGRGETTAKKCKHCGGDGILAKSASVKVKIPGGIDNGQSIRVTGHGEAAPHGGQSGDMYVQVHIKASLRFKREGFDVYTDSEISFAQAVLGANIPVETIDGPIEIKVPEGTESNQLIRLKGKGITHLGRGTRGDQYVRVKIRVPKKVSKKAKQLLEELGGEL